MSGATIANILDGWPSKPAIVVGSGGPTLSRAELLSLATQFAQSLRASGVQPGDLVTIVDSNTVEFAVAFIGTLLARAVAAPLNQNYQEAEFKFYMEDAGSKLVVVGAKGIPAAEKTGIAPVIGLNVNFSEGGRPALELTKKEGAFDLKVAPEGEALADPPQPEDIALFLHTSGTTSRPKGVPLTQSNLAASLDNICKTYEFTHEDVSLLVMPLFHVHGLMAAWLAPTSAGATVVFPAEGRFAAGTFWKDAAANRITFYTAVPTIHQILVARADKDYPASDPPPIRVIRSCSSSLAPATLAALEEKFKAPVLEAYAMTEASHQMTSNPLPKYGPHKPGTVGKAQGSVKVAILNDKNEILAPGEIGEVSIQGPNVTAGYRSNPKANEEAFAGGWFHTGDQGKLDEEGYLQLTGRIKELINRGGEKISPIEVDGALLSHPGVAEAVSFAAPDEKYGESVAAAVVLNEEGKKIPDIVADIQRHVGTRLSKFKVPTQIFITEELPKTATGKIQRRFMVDAFINKKKEDGAASTTSTIKSLDLSALPNDGYFTIARTLCALGVRVAYGVIGIPVTQLASALQAVGIRFISFRNEQSAGYAAAAAGYLSGVPGVLVTVSGPGVIHALAGVSDAQINTWPLVLISGSCEADEVGKGAFQELDQLAAVKPYVKYAGQASKVAQLPGVIEEAFKAAVSGRPGAAYVDVPSNVLMAKGGEGDGVRDEDLRYPEAAITVSKPQADPDSITQVIGLLKSAKSPLFVVGKGAAWARAEEALRALSSETGIPVLATAMGRGVVPDTYAYSANAARSLALGGADVAVIFGARLNWQLHFGESPRWASGVKFVLVDVEPSERDAGLAAVALRGDAGAVADQLREQLQKEKESSSSHSVWAEWAQKIAAKSATARDKLAIRLAKTTYPLDYSTTLRVVRDAISALPTPPIVVAEGANTMDNARLFLEPVLEPRLRLDAGTWGTMGVGPGYAIAAATQEPARRTVAVEGDSAFGFSGMELETAIRYDLPITFIIFNNGGIYGGDRRPEPLRQAARRGLAAAGYPNDPNPTDFVPVSRYELLADAFGGRGVAVKTADELNAALTASLQAQGPTIINVAIDPLAGVESGNVHAFNFKPPEKSN